tara:strand:- start:42898 stop:43239 length:342 start_codon:yes stop_codon:yes gene_type:complete
MEREKLPEQVRDTGKQFESAMKSLSDAEIVGEVRGSHFMIGIEFVKDKDSKASFDASVEIGGRVAAAAQERGLIVRPLGNSLILSPTLVMTPDLIRRTESILRDSIAQVQDAL